MFRSPWHHGRFAVALLLVAACSSQETAPSRTDGKELYLSRGCAACHGREGAGDGPAAASFSQPPRDLRRPESYRTPPSLDSVSQVILDGLAGTMPSHSYLPPDEREAIARFVLDLALAGSSTTNATQP